MGRTGASKGSQNQDHKNQAFPETSWHKPIVPLMGAHFADHKMTLEIIPEPQSGTGLRRQLLADKMGLKTFPPFSKSKAEGHFLDPQNGLRIWTAKWPQKPIKNGSRTSPRAIVGLSKKFPKNLAFHGLETCTTTLTLKAGLVMANMLY